MCAYIAEKDNVGTVEISRSARVTKFNWAMSACHWHIAEEDSVDDAASISIRSHFILFSALLSPPASSTSSYFQLFEIFLIICHNYNIISC